MEWLRRLFGARPQAPKRPQNASEEVASGLERAVSQPAGDPGSVPDFVRIISRLHNADGAVRAAAARVLDAVDFAEVATVEAFLAALEGRPLGHEAAPMGRLVRALAHEGVRARILPVLLSKLRKSGTNELLYYVAESAECDSPTRIVAMQCRAELGDWRYPLKLLKQNTAPPDIRRAAAAALERFDQPEVRAALEEYGAAASGLPSLSSPTAVAPRPAQPVVKSPSSVTTKSVDGHVWPIKTAAWDDVSYNVASWPHCEECGRNIGDFIDCAATGERNDPNRRNLMQERHQVLIAYLATSVDRGHDSTSYSLRGTLSEELTLENLDKAFLGASLLRPWGWPFARILGWHLWLRGGVSAMAATEARWKTKSMSYLWNGIGDGNDVFMV